jgi:hypothetical protein
MQAAPKLCRALRFWGLHPVPIGFERCKIGTLYLTKTGINRKEKGKFRE